MTKMASSKLVYYFLYVCLYLCLYERVAGTRRIDAHFPSSSGVLIRFNPLKDLSAVQEITGSVQRRIRKTSMLGYIEET